MHPRDKGKKFIKFFSNGTLAAAVTVHYSDLIFPLYVKKINYPRVAVECLVDIFTFLKQLFL